MPSPIIATLELLRKQLNISLNTLATETGISSQRLEEIAQSHSPTPPEEIILSRAFRIGFHPATEIQSLDEPVRLLTLKQEFTELDDKARLRVFQLAQCARNLESLRNAQSETTSWKRFLKTRDALNLPRPAVNQVPWQQGEQLAMALRKALNLGNRPIDSMSRLAKDHFPDLTLLFSDLGRQGPDGILFADESRGVTIALNQAAPKNQWLQVRRFNLAHELGHALTDIGLLLPPMAHVTLRITPSQLAVEQRANAFAAYFLCPKQELLNLVDRHQDAQKAAEEAVNTYCLPYKAVRIMLRNHANLEIPASEKRVKFDKDKWHALEAETDFQDFPLPDVPVEYRSDMARVATESYLVGLISRQQLALTLGLAPDSDITRLPPFLFGKANPAVLFAELREILASENIEIQWPAT